MPREQFHWAVLDSVSARAESSSSLQAVSQCLSSFKTSALVGAMAHDAPYYYHWGAGDFEKVASELHGRNGNDTLEPLRRLASKIIEIENKETRERFWAFFLGMLTHFASDIVLHPLVNYFTGNYHDVDKEKKRASRIRHRLLEVYIDAWVGKRYEFAHSIRYKTLVRNLGKDFFLELCSVLAEIFNTPAKHWRDGMHDMADLQTACLSPFGGLTMALMNLVSGGKFAPIEALSSFRRNGAFNIFDSKLDYKNPYSGEPRSANLRELLEESANHSLVLFELMNPLIARETLDVNQVFASIKGPSLDYGIVGIKNNEGKYFSEKGIELPGLAIT